MLKKHIGHSAAMAPCVCLSCRCDLLAGWVKVAGRVVLSGGLSIRLRLQCLCACVCLKGCVSCGTSIKRPAGQQKQLCCLRCLRCFHKCDKVMWQGHVDCGFLECRRDPDSSTSAGVADRTAQCQCKACNFCNGVSTGSVPLVLLAYTHTLQLVTVGLLTLSWELRP